MHLSSLHSVKLTTLLTTLALTATLAPTNLLAGPPIQQWQSPGGSRVLFVAAPALPMIDLQLVCDAGSARDPAGSVALMTNSLLFSGAGKLDADAIAAGFEDLGAQTGSSVSRDMASVSLRSLNDDDHLKPALALFTQVISEANFPAIDFERERGNLQLGLQQEKQSPGALAKRAFYQKLYDDHPYAAMSSGTQQSVADLSREKLIEFKQAHYQRNNCLVTLVGDLSRSQAEAIAQQITKDLPAGSAQPALRNVASIKKNPKQLTQQIVHPSQQTHLLLGQPTIARGDDDFFALFLGNHVLGGSGLTSRISQVIREQEGLAYSSYSYFAPMHRQGPFVMGLQTRNDQADKAAKLLRAELKKFVAEGPSEAEVTAAKQNLTGGFPLRIDSNSKIIGYLSMIGFYGLPLDYLDNWVDRINAISAQQIRETFQRRVNLNQLVEVRVGGE